MSSEINILVIGRNAQILETVLRLIQSKPGWHAHGSITDEEAIKKFNLQHFDLVLIGGGVDEVSEASLKNEFERINPGVRMVRHYGGGSGLLFNEIIGALNPSLS